jgi:hypothetical protein
VQQQRNLRVQLRRMTVSQLSALGWDPKGGAIIQRPSNKYGRGRNFPPVPGDAAWTRLP